MGPASVLLLLVALGAVGATLDQRVRAAPWHRALAAVVGAALTPPVLGAALLWLANPAAADGGLVVRGLAASAGVGLCVGAVTLGLRGPARERTRP